MSTHLTYTHTGYYVQRPSTHKLISVINNLIQKVPCGISDSHDSITIIFKEDLTPEERGLVSAYLDDYNYEQI